MAPHPVEVLSDDPAVREVALQQGVGAQTSTAATPAPERNLAALRQYQRERLLRGPLTTMSTSVVPIAGGGVTTFVPVSHTGISWTVYDGGGQAHGARDFALRVGDHATVADLQRRRNQNLSWTVGLLAAGNALLVSGLHVSMSTDHMTTGLVMVVAGFGVNMGALGPAFAAGVGRLPEKIGKVYSPEEVDAMIEIYNQELRARLQVSEEDTFDIETR